MSYEEIGSVVDELVNDTGSAIYPGFMTSDECIAMCDHQNKEDYLFYGSLAVNALLLLTTSISEIMSACKCKATGVFDGIVLLVRKATGLEDETASEADGQQRRQEAAEENWHDQNFREPQCEIEPLDFSSLSIDVPELSEDPPS